MTSLINKFWQGKVTLWKSYWLIGELLNSLVVLFLINLEIRLFNNANIYNSLPFFDFQHLSFISKILIFLWTVYITVGVWRSAERYEGRIIWTILTLIFLSYRLFALRLIFF